MSSRVRDDSAVSAIKDGNKDQVLLPAATAGQTASTLMQKSQSLATLLHHGMSTTKNTMMSYKCGENTTNNNFAVRSSSKTTEQMVRSI